MPSRGRSPDAEHRDPEPAARSPALICFRRADHATPLRVIPAAQAGRYNAAGSTAPTQYLCLHPLGPFAELMRNHDLCTEEQVRAVRTRTWAVQVPLDGLVEITFSNAADFGLTAPDLVADDHRACQDLAARLRGAHRGLIVPSAALPGTRNVVLFGARVAAPYLTAPQSELDLPAGITAQDGRPLASLLERVCFRAAPHRALAAWSSGASFELVEPDWSLADAIAPPRGLP